MRTKKFRRRSAAALILMSVCLFCMAATAFAHEKIDTEKKAALTVYFGKDGTNFSEAGFEIYRIADVAENGSFTLTGDFSDYSVSLENLNSSGWRALAQTLDSYAARDKLAPLRTERTGKDGRAVFENLDTGLYLVCGEQYVSGAYTYTPEPTVVCLPKLTENDNLSYAPEISCKFGSDYRPHGAKVKRKVLKVWKDRDDKEKRPEEITVQLLENGTVVDTVKLNEENNWEYTWENLDGGSKWQIAESKTPDGYVVSVMQEGITFIMTNTYSEPSSEPPNAPKYPSVPPGKLPQTGMLWWPVPLLLCGGIILLLTGCIVLRRHGEKDEQ